VTEATTRNSAARKSEGGVLELVWIILQALLIALVVRTLLFQPFNIPSGSLVPTLLVGDYLFVSKYSYGYSKYSLPFGPPPFDGRIMASEPKVGDIAVFKFPKDNKTDYIKRVIGLPGDKIRLIDARLYINDQECPRERLPDYKTIDAYGKETSVPHYMETLPNGVKHEIIQKDGDTGYWSNTSVYTVPPGHFFMMGDNRDNSSDSRVMTGEGVGYVPFDNFEGRAEVIFFSVDDHAPPSRLDDEPLWKFWDWRLFLADDGVPAWQFWHWHWRWSVRWPRLFTVVR
jgi:signal peptidase I